MVRVTVCCLAALAAALALGTQLTYSAAETAYRDAVAGRLRMIAVQFADTIQASQSLGIALEAQETLPALLRSEAAGVPDLAAIEVVDPEGAVLFASAMAEERGEAVVVPVLDDLGRQTGSVRMLRDVTGEAARLAVLRRDLMARAVPIGVGILAAAGFALLAILRGSAAGTRTDAAALAVRPVGRR